MAAEEVSRRVELEKIFITEEMNSSEILFARNIFERIEYFLGKDSKRRMLIQPLNPMRKVYLIQKVAELFGRVTVHTCFEKTPEVVVIMIPPGSENNWTADLAQLLKKDMEAKKKGFTYLPSNMTIPSDIKAYLNFGCSNQVFLNSFYIIDFKHLNNMKLVNTNMSIDGTSSGVGNRNVGEEIKNDAMSIDGTSSGFGNRNVGVEIKNDASTASKMNELALANTGISTGGTSSDTTCEKVKAFPIVRVEIKHGTGIVLITNEPALVNICVFTDVTGFQENVGAEVKDGTTAVSMNEPGPGTPNKEVVLEIEINNEGYVADFKEHLEIEIEYGYTTDRELFDGCNFLLGNLIWMLVILIILIALDMFNFTL